MRRLNYFDSGIQTDFNLCVCVRVFRFSRCQRWVRRWSWSWPPRTAPECGGWVWPGSAAIGQKTTAKAAWWFWPIRATSTWCRCRRSRCRFSTPASAERMSAALLPASSLSMARVSTHTVRWRVLVRTLGDNIYFLSASLYHLNYRRNPGIYSNLNLTGP